MNKDFIRGFWQGLSGSGLWETPEFPKTTKLLKIAIDKRTDTEKLQGDWKKIGGDFNVAINRFQRNSGR